MLKIATANSNIMIPIHRKYQELKIKSMKGAIVANIIEYLNISFYVNNFAIYPENTDAMTPPNAKIASIKPMLPL